MRVVRAIAGVELRRFLRDRSNIFFVFVFPLLLVGVIGSQFGAEASQGRIVTAGPDGALRERLERSLRDGDVVVRRASPAEARLDLARGRTDVGLFFDDAAARAFAGGKELRIEVVVGTRPDAPATLQRVRAAVDRVGREPARSNALVDAGADPATAAELLEAARDDVRAPELREVEDELSREFAGVTGFQVGAVGQTLLFVFLSSLAGSATLIQARRLGVMRRTLAAPVSTRQAVAGEALGRLAIAVFQGAYIIVATSLLFGVEWGTLWVAFVILAVFSLVAAGAAMLIGSLLDDDAAASGIGVGVGLVTAALGGCMLPIELFPDALEKVALVTPHAWAHSALSDVQRHGAGLIDVLPQLGVLAAMALGVLAVGSVALRRSLQRAI